ncbi:MAG: DNA/RNA nuclease SfsA [Candidatus Hodarchaeales archaeon]
MRCSGNYVIGEFLERQNRFLAQVRIPPSQTKYEAHVPDPGRLRELLVPNVEILLEKHDNPRRKTRFSLIGVKFGSTWVNIDSQISNRLFKEEFTKIKRYQKFKLIKSEYTFQKSRFDFLMEDLNNPLNPKKTLIEVKSATLVKDQIAMFPDAPTRRGVRHVKELTEALSAGYNAEIVFITKRNDASHFTPNKEMDPSLYDALVIAKETGVQLCAIVCNYDPIESKELTILKEIPIIGV